MFLAFNANATKIESPSCVDLQYAAEQMDMARVGYLIQYGMDEYDVEIMTEETTSEVQRIDHLILNQAPNLKKYIFSHCAKNNRMYIKDVMRVGVETNFK